jgi:hypothetical protein
VSGRASPVAGAPAVAVERLWLDRLYALAGPVAHELRNALNGVAVNVEVVRSRARGEAPASSVGHFADTAADQLEVLAGLTDALVALLRPVVEPVDVGYVTARVATLLGAVARPEGGAVELVVVPDGATVRTAVPGEPLRVLVAALMLDGFDRAARLCCELDGTAAPTLRLRRASGPPLPEISADVRALAAHWGARLDGGPAAWSIVLPPPAG